MMKYLLTTSTTFLTAALVVGCCHNKCSTNTSKPLEGNPGATTNQSAGYDNSDPNHYHPMTDDTKQYHPTDPNAVQPTH